MRGGQPQELVELDGSQGGGQLVRMAVGLSALTGTPVRISNIRKIRPDGGELLAQHLAGVRWLAHACNAHTEGMEKGSTTLLFQPNSKPGHVSPAFTKKAFPDNTHVYECRLDIGTAGAASLALQAILPYILFSRLPTPIAVHLTITGGTNVSGSPSWDYVSQVFLPTLHKIGLPKMTTTLTNRAWFSGGSQIGSFTITIPTRKSAYLPAFTYAPDPERPPHSPTDRPFIRLLLLAPPESCPFLDQTVALEHKSPIYNSVTTSYTPTSTPQQTYILATATYQTHILASDHLQSTKPPARSPQKSLNLLINKVLSKLEAECSSNTFVDEHMRDQLVIYAALAQGRSRIYNGHDGPGDERRPRKVSQHTSTAEWVAECMLPNVRFDGEGGCEGAGFQVDYEGGGRDIVREMEDLDLG